MPQESDPLFPETGDRGATILLAEDEPLIRLVLADHLRKCGFDVLEVSNAGDAIELLQTGAAIHLVFSDVRMPGEIDGFGLARWVQANRAELPVILASGNVRKSDLARELCEANHLFAKPYDLDEVAAHIRMTLR